MMRILRMCAAPCAVRRQRTHKFVIYFIAKLWNFINQYEVCTNIHYSLVSSLPSHHSQVVIITITHHHLTTRRSSLISSPPVRIISPLFTPRVVAEVVVEIIKYVLHLKQQIPTYDTFLCLYIFCLENNFSTLLTSASNA